MKKLNIVMKLMLTISMFFMVYISSLSETGYGFGVTSGYTFVYTEAKYVYNCETCGHMSDNNSNGYFAGLTYELNMKKYVDFSLMAKLYYTKYNFLYSQYGDNYPSIVRSKIDTNQYETVYSQTRFDYYGNVDYLSLDLTPKVKVPFVNLNVFAGISISYMLKSSYTETYNLVNPDNVRFPHSLDANPRLKYSSDGRTAYLKEGEIPYKNNFRYGLKAGLSYDYDFAGFCFSPFVSVDIPLSSMVNKYNMDCTPEICAYRTDLHWKVWFSQAGIDVKYVF